MKTTLEIPDPLFRKAKATAAEQGRSLKALVAEALQEKLLGDVEAASPMPPWMRGFGGMAHRRRENRRIQKLVDAEFGQLEPEDLE